MGAGGRVDRDADGERGMNRCGELHSTVDTFWTHP